MVHFQCCYFVKNIHEPQDGEKTTLCKDAKKHKENVGKCLVFHNSKPMQFGASKCNMWTHDLLHDSTQHDYWRWEKPKCLGLLVDGANIGLFKKGMTFQAYQEGIEELENLQNHYNIRVDLVKQLWTKKCFNIGWKVLYIVPLIVTCNLFNHRILSSNWEVLGIFGIVLKLLSKICCHVCNKHSWGSWVCHCQRSRCMCL